VETKVDLQHGLLLAFAQDFGNLLSVIIFMLVHDDSFQSILTGTKEISKQRFQNGRAKE
jgi:hypothetical protein